MNGKRDPKSKKKPATQQTPKRPAQIPAIDKLISEAREIIAIAEDLRDRGLPAEAFTFGFAAAQRLRAARVLQDLHDGSSQQVT